ncbi:MAG TPA: hypothetical protein VG165_00645 [Solirubrobacteraceae bacterium]|jgi:hypothetical protein|nr:hypothetical protein [Solirubrobacteraceae bacterium]
MNPGNSRSSEKRHELLIAVVADALARWSAWPRYDYVDAILDHEHGIAIADALADLPRELAWPQSGYSPQSLIVATVAGLAGNKAVGRDLERFVAIIAHAARAERTFIPSPTDHTELTLDRDDVAAALGELPAGPELKRLALLLDIDGVVRFTGSADAEWSLRVDNTRIRRYHGVTDIGDYVARRPAPPVPHQAIAPAPRPSIFVLMAFGQQWSDNVYDTICQACPEVGQGTPGLTWQRADDIDEPGRITDQIVNAIENATLIVADVTGYNPNVMFELGYADAANKRIVLLNQDLDTTPFDIKDWRQISYDPAQLSNARERMASFIRGALIAQQRHT